MAVSTREWLDLIDREYLREFITDGGSAIKFVVIEPDNVDRIAARVAEMARNHRLVHVTVDAASVRIHMVQDLFFAASRQIDWDATAQGFMEELFKRQGYEWPISGSAATLNVLAEANGVDVTILSRDVRRWLTTELMRDTRMAQDFRVALTHLCFRRFEPPESDRPADSAPVLDWLRGEARQLGPLRRAQISSRIGRHNARAMLRSFCRWLRICGHAGLCVSLDIRQFSKTGSAINEGSVRYSPAAVMDAYEVLRQLVDDAERMEGLLLITMAGNEFLDGDAKRSLDAYTALKMRVWADVHAQGRDDPLAPLVVLTWP